jgi:hypothetical protein
MLLNTVIMIVNYDRHMFIVQAMILQELNWKIDIFLIFRRAFSLFTLGTFLRSSEIASRDEECKEKKILILE